MAGVNIQGKEYTIGKVFSNDFVFSIPHYQRPYSWTTEHAEELLDDLLTFLGDDEKNIVDLNPYFLGSIVLIKDDPPPAEVVDGQQRLTTLAIFMSVMRAFVSPDFATSLSKRLFEKEDPLLETPDRPRLTLRERDNKFFQQYIFGDDGAKELAAIKDKDIPDAQANIRGNALLYYDRFSQLSAEKLERLAKFIINRCYLIVVTTPDLDSAYRIFSVLNDRGMDLSHADILKAEIIGKIEENERDKYTEEWEDIEELLGVQGFQDLFGHIRMIYRKSKPQESVLEGVRKFVNPTENPKQFIDKKLLSFADAYHDVVFESYKSQLDAEKLNELFGWLNRIDNSDWIPPAILYYSRFSGNHSELVRFFRCLERLAAGMMITRTNINYRMERYGRLLSAIESGENLYLDNSPLNLTLEERESILQQLNGDIYRIRNVPKYVLLRLDSAISEGSANYAYNVVSIEHVLPQSPRNGSQWCSWFPTPEFREQYTHRLGNLVLLSRRKNSQARNYDFQKKKDSYFKAKTGVSPFAITTQVLNEREWTPEVVERRQQEFIQLAKDIWYL